MKTFAALWNFKRAMSLWVLGLSFLATSSGPCWAAFGEDLEKPKPEFTAEEDKIVAKLIPRGKSTSILIEFAVSEAKLLGVEGMDFDEVKDASVDVKDFRSELFRVSIGGLPRGGEAKISLTCRYFTQATELWAYNAQHTPHWVNSQAQNIDHPERVQELLVAVKDGGPLDSDGAANGEITLIAGPKDSFWGYALGTLFIRFFGIFIVLGILEAGMLVSGRFFQHLESRRSAKPAPTAAQPEAADISGETAAAIGVALEMYLASLKEGSTLSLGQSTSPGWQQQGRDQWMSDRSKVFHRPHRP